MKKIDEILEEFDKYKKSFEMKSEPYNYIHKGLDPSFQFSDFKSHIRQACKEYAESVVPRERNLDEDLKNKDFLSRGFNNCRSQMLNNINKS